MEQSNEVNTLTNEAYRVEQSNEVNTLIDEVNEEYSFWRPQQDEGYPVDTIHTSTKKITSQRFNWGFRSYPTRHFECLNLNL